MIEYFGCNPLEIFKYGDDFDSLFNREIFQKVKTKEQSELGLVRVTFKLNPKTIESIIQSNVSHIFLCVQQFIHRMEQPDIIQIFHECQSQMFFHIF